MGTMKKAIALLLACMLMIGIFAGCSSQDAGNSEKNDQQTQPAAASGKEDEAVAVAGPVELTVGSAMAWETLTPFRNNRVWNIIYSRMLYDSLAWRIAGGEVVPVAAKSWEVEQDGVTWNVEIYDYITDSAGNHITADDIVWFIEESMKRAQKPIFNQVESVEKTGEYTFKVVMKQDMYGAFDSVLLGTFVVSKASFESDPDGFVSNVISSAPYKVTDFVSGSQIVLEKRDDYWQKEELIPDGLACNVDKFTMKYIAEASQQQIALETGEVDGFLAITQSLLPAFDENEYTIVGRPSISGTILRFSGHKSRAISTDVNLRKAIAYAIDENALIQGVYAGQADPMYGPESAGTVGFQDAWMEEENYNYNPELAKEYLAKSNYSGETLELLASSSTVNDRMGAMIQSYLGEIGVTLKLNIVDRALYTASGFDGSAFDMVIFNPGNADLANRWQSAWDITSYPDGDASGRNDTELYAMLCEAWSNAGFGDENINKIHDYLMENLYDYGMLQPNQCDIYRNTVGVSKEVYLFGGCLDFIACEYGK